MLGSSPHPSSNVAAAARLQFSVDLDPSHGDSQPSVLLLTQNVGGIEAAYTGLASLLDASPGMSPTSDQLLSGGVLGAFPSIVATMTSPSYAQVPDDLDAEGGVSKVVRQQVADFLADLRTWLHRMSYVSAAARKAEKGTSTAAAGASASASPSGSNAAAGRSAEFFLRDYTPAARPPMVDLIVVHFQEVGGKYKNKHFNKYFKEQLSAVLLPEAGWSSGLLMDERESDRVVGSSSACQRTRTTTANPSGSAAVGQRASPASMTGHLRAPAWDFIDSHSRRSSNDASGAETDVSEEEAADLFFTAMGSIVFLSPRVMGISSCLSVPHRTYIPIVDDPMTYAGDAGRLFLSGKFSEAGRSRKGFLLVSLRIGTVQFNVCNLHLFNDDDNRIAFEQSPSKYTSRRIRAVQEAMAECSAVVDFQEPLFLFGDYNVRMDGKAFTQWAEETEQIAIRAGKKQLRCPEHLWTFFADPARTSAFRRAYDTEPRRLMDEVAVQAKVVLGEMPVTFAPTYSRLPYRHRGGGGSGSAQDTANAAAVAAVVESVAGFDDTSAASPAASPGPQSTVNGTGGRAAEPRGSADELNRTQTPSSVAAAALPASTQSPPPPASPVPPAVTEPLTHVAAAPTRDNFSHDRLPAWCDRVLFNVAGLEWISGDRARPPTTTQPQPAGTAVRDRRKVHEAAPPRWYAYDAIDFVHMDHDGVYLMF